MVSQKSHASFKETFGKQKEENTGYELPKDLNPWQSFAFESTRYLVPSDVSSSGWLYYSSDSEDFVVTTLKSERKDPTPALETPDTTSTPIEVAVIPDDEAIESPEKVAPVLLSKGYKPHNRVSAVRDYPIPIVPLRRSNRAVAVRDFPFPQSSVQPQLSDASEPTEESECEAKESSKEIELEWSGLIPGDSIVSMYNISLNSFGLSSEDGGIDIDSVGLVDRSETSELEFMEEIASNFNTPDSMTFETKQLSHKLSDAQDPLEAQSDSDESCRKSKLKNPGGLPLRRSNRILKRKAMEATNKRKRSKH